MGSIYLCGSEEQKQRWLPAMARMEKIGAFALTEPDVGSGVAGGLTTTAQRDGDVWVLTGQKKWIGNATFADLVIVWAATSPTTRSRASSWRHPPTGFTPTKMRHKIALRVVQNAEITLDNVRVLEDEPAAAGDDVPRHREGAAPDQGRRGLAGDRLRARRLRACPRLRQAARAVRPADRRLPAGPGPARAHAVQRDRVGLPVRAAVPASGLQDQAKDHHSALAKAFCTVRMRETVGWARELLGGNGILLENQVGRFVADAEAIYSYEGTREINTLIVGRAITGLGAFV